MFNACFHVPQDHLLICQPAHHLPATAPSPPDTAPLASLCRHPATPAASGPHSPFHDASLPLAGCNKPRSHQTCLMTMSIILVLLRITTTLCFKLLCKDKSWIVLFTNHCFYVFLDESDRYHSQLYPQFSSPFPFISSTHKIWFHMMLKSDQFVSLTHPWNLLIR